MAYAVCQLRKTVDSSLPNLIHDAVRCTPIRLFNNVYADANDGRFIHAQDSRAKLKITKDMMLEIFSFNQVMPGYLDLVFLFGENIGPNDLKFSAFREQTALRIFNVGLDDLGRSGQKFELCYNLKTVSRKDLPASPRLHKGPRTVWSVRQAGVFHKFDVKFGTTFWTFTRGSLDLEERFKEVTDQDDRPEDRCFDTPLAAFRSSLAIHAMMIHWASESWRWYLQWLDEEIEKETGRLTSESRVPSKSRKWYQAQDLQQLQTLSDQVSDVILSLEGNMDVIRALREFYYSLSQDPDFPLRTTCADYVTMFVKQTQNANYDLKLQLSRAKALSGRVLQRKDLMLQYMNAQTAEKQEELTSSAYRVTISAENEAIVMRIITVVTLLFLPATFVSTFFSTPAISFSQGTGNGNSGYNSNSSDDDFDSTVALYRWLEISIPLTVATLAAAFGVYCWEKRRRELRRQREMDEKFCP